MGARLIVFIGVAAIVIVVPGPGTVVVTKHALMHGRRKLVGALYLIWLGFQALRAAANASSTAEDVRLATERC